MSKTRISDSKALADKTEYLAYFPAEHTAKGIAPPVYVLCRTPLELADAVLNGAVDVSDDDLSWRAYDRKVQAAYDALY